MLNSEFITLGFLNNQKKKKKDIYIGCHRIIGYFSMERTTGGSLIQIPVQSRGKSDQVALSLIQSGPENLQGQREMGKLHSLCGQPVPIPDWCYGEKKLLLISS